MAFWLIIWQILLWYAMTKHTPIKTQKQLAALKARDKEYHVAIAHHPRLFIKVATNGTKTWIYRYTPPIGKQQKMSFGTYPSTSLMLAQKKWQHANELLAKGIDPKTDRQTQKQAQIAAYHNRFGQIAQQWLNSQKNKTNTLQRKTTRTLLLCDYFGDCAIAHISSPQVLSVLLDIQEKSRQANGQASDKAKRCAGYLSQIFDYAIGRGFCQHNPVHPIKSQLENFHYRERAAIIKPTPFGELLNKIEHLQNIELSTKNNLRLLALLFVRNGDIRRMRWQDIDFKEKYWYLKPIKGNNKENMVKEMIVPLSPQAIQVLRSQEQLTGGFDYVFYSKKAKKHGIISENTANDVLNELGYQGIHCAHGYRATAKTLLVQYLGYGEAVAEMALGHIIKAPNGRAYSRYDFLEERIEMMNVWANYLDALTNGVDTTHFKLTQHQNPTQMLQTLIDAINKTA